MLRQLVHLELRVEIQQLLIIVTRQILELQLLLEEPEEQTLVVDLEEYAESQKSFWLVIEII
jgi:hypothetical protein